MSTSEKPKQFIDVLGVGSSLLQLTLQRFEGIVAKDNVWVVTNAKYAPLVHEQLPEVPEDHILKEPPLAQHCALYSLCELAHTPPRP